MEPIHGSQQIAGIVLIPVWAGLFGLASRVQDWGPPGLFGAVAALAVLDGVLTVIAARTWRREEVLSQR